MATIKLTNSDLRKMISEAVSKLCEGVWYQSEPLCRLPYFVSVNFSDHAIDREGERNLSEDDIIANLKLAIQDIINDFHAKKIKPDDYLKVIDRDRCIVAVCGIHPTFNRKRIQQLVVITAYIWDGRINIDHGHTYYVNEPSEQYLETKKWNEENQDKAIAYTEWKRNADIEKQRKGAEKWYEKGSWEYSKDETPSRLRLARVKKAEKEREAERMTDIYSNMSPEDYEALRDYDMKMDYLPLSQKGSANRDLRAMDLRQMRREADRQRKYYGDKVKDVPDDELVKYPKILGKIDLPQGKKRR